MEEINKSLKESQGSANKQLKEMNKMIQDMKGEREAIQRTQAEGTVKMKNLGIQTGTRQSSFTNRI